MSKNIIFIKDDALYELMSVNLPLNNDHSFYVSFAKKIVPNSFYYLYSNNTKSKFTANSYNKKKEFTISFHPSGQYNIGKFSKDGQRLNVKTIPLSDIKTIHLLANCYIPRHMLVTSKKTPNGNDIVLDIAEIDNKHKHPMFLTFFIINKKHFLNKSKNHSIELSYTKNYRWEAAAEFETLTEPHFYTSFVLNVPNRPQNIPNDFEMTIYGVINGNRSQ